MSSNSKFDALLEERNNLFLDYECVINAQLGQERDYWMKNINTLSELDGKSYTLFDLQQGQIIAHHSGKCSIANKVQLSLGDLLDEKYLWNITHVDDQEFLLKLEIIAFRFMMLLSARQQKEFALVYQRRIMLNDKDYQCQIQTINPVLTDENGIPWIVMITSQPCKISNTYKKERYQLFSIHPRHQLSTFKTLWDDKLTHLTNAEKKVLFFIGKGHTKSEISAFMKIEENTVRKHCANIHLKLFVDAIHKASDFSDQLQLQ